MELYDYGARFYDAQIGRWGVLDPKTELLEMSSPYVFCLNRPLMYRDPDGELPILINGRVGSGQERGSSSYWDPNLLNAIRNSGIPNPTNNSKDRSEFFFVDGDRYYFESARNNTYDPSQNGVRRGSYGLGNNPGERRRAGYEIGKQDFQAILAKLAKDPQRGKIIEKIQIYTHSRGAAFGAGYIEALLEMIKQNSGQFADPNNVIDLVYNMAPHQSNAIDEPGNLNAYSEDHSWDALSGNDMSGLKAKFSNNQGSGGIISALSTTSFVKSITAFTKAFASSNGKSDQLINDFVNRMKRDYGITVTVKK